ncbi:MAG: ankyrin repeat domain-containing protein [Gammaproteobacteria bacterium]
MTTIRNFIVVAILAGLFVIIGGAAFADDGSTPLHQAAEDGNITEVKRLIAGGVDIEAKTNTGYTPLLAAAWYGQTETAPALVKAGADVFARGDGEMPLDIAIEKHGKDSEIAHVLRETMEKQGGK